MRHLSSVIVFVIGLTFAIVLAACATSPIPEINQDNPQNEDQQVESEPTQEISTATAQMEQTPLLEEPASESNSVEDSPAQADQSPGSSYPPPEESTGGDPASENGYPAPVEILPTPSLMPAYPAPTEDQGGSPNTDTGNPPPVKTGLEATDPSTVKLASGGLQFVEFFAFW